MMVPATETEDLATQTIPVKLTPRQVETIHLTDEPMSTWIREAVEQRLARDIPSYRETTIWLGALEGEDVRLGSEFEARYPATETEDLATQTRSLRPSSRR